MKSKLFSVRVPAEELAAFEAVLAGFPGASPALLIRALVLDATKMSLTNSLSKLAVQKALKK